MKKMAVTLRRPCRGDGAADNDDESLKLQPRRWQGRRQWWSRAQFLVAVVHLLRRKMQQCVQYRQVIDDRGEYSDPFNLNVRVLFFSKLISKKSVFRKIGKCDRVFFSKCKSI